MTTGQAPSPAGFGHLTGASLSRAAEAMTSQTPRRRIGILLLPKFSLVSMANCTALYAQVNQVLERDVFEVVTKSLAGA